MIDNSDVEKLLNVGLDCFQQKDINIVIKSSVDTILDLCNCDGCLFFSVEDDYLSLKCIEIKSKNYSRSGLEAEAIIPQAYLPDLKKQQSKSLFEQSALNKEVINIENIYNYPDLNLESIQNLDEELDYQTTSILSLPIVDINNEVLAVVEFLNAKDSRDNNISFTKKHIDIIKSVLSGVVLLLQNNKISKRYSQLLESFIETWAKAIDHKSPYTGAHCQRVPIITRMLTSAVIEDESSIFDNFNLSSSDWYALHIASWLHDCGKVTTPDYILDKSTKLEAVYNRIHEIRNRFEILRRDAQIEYLKKSQKTPELKSNLQREYAQELDRLEKEFDHVAKCNTGETPLTQEDVAKLNKIAKKTFTRYFSRAKGLSWAEINNIDDLKVAGNPQTENLIQDTKTQRVGTYNLGELYNLSIKSGTINSEERDKINEHIVITIDMLKSISFSKELSNVVEYAGGHHERVDGKGYPNGLTKDEMSIPARIMAIADIFEALTSVDRPYKKPKKLSQVLSIMQEMKKSGHIDPDIYEVFIKSKVYLDYARQYLQPEQIDEFNDKDYL